VTITMFDSAYNSQFPADPQAVAAYVDGGIGDQPNYASIASAFPQAHHLSITLFADMDADALDVETGASRPSDIAGWYARQRRRGIDRPCIYASTSAMESEVIPVIRAMPVVRPAVRLWTAHYGEGEHICGPGKGTCGQLSIGADGTQWTPNAMGRTLDQSLLLDDFFGTPVPSPATYAEFDMSKLPVLRQGDSDKPGQFWSVRRLQALTALTGRINGIPAAMVDDDGVFGPATAAAVRAVQEHYGIAVDGRAGAQTWGVLLTGSPA
jgi:peptidoglycan hydrolase-like protein with peptidoglycan-binding domain